MHWSPIMLKEYFLKLNSHDIKCFPKWPPEVILWYKNLLLIATCSPKPTTQIINRIIYLSQVFLLIWGPIGKFPDCCCYCLCKRRWEGRTRSHFHKPIASVCHVTLRCEHALLLHESFFNFVFCFVCDGWQNQAACLHQVLHEAR
jgi:hypothetical protein